MLGIAFLYLPIVILVIYSFNASRLVAVWGGWSTHWYAELVDDAALLDAAFISIRVALRLGERGNGTGDARGVGAGPLRPLPRPARCSRR